MDADPAIAVIVPVYNDPDGLETTLDSLVAQTYPSRQFTVYVVDNDSTDDTKAVAEQFRDRHPDLLTVLSETDVQSSYAARNTGIERSDAELLAFIDADMAVDESWLEDVAREATERDAVAMCCNVEIRSKGEPPNIYETFDVVTGFPIELYVTERNTAAAGCLVARRELFEELGTFDYRLVSGGDSEFGDRLADAGYELHFAENVTMHHPARDSLNSHLKKSYRIGRGVTQKARLYPDKELNSLVDPRNYLPPLPGRIRRRATGYESLTILERAAIYLLFYLTKSLAFMAGRIQETVNPTNITRPPDHLPAQSSEQIDDV